MSKATCEVVNNALKAHDQDSDYWLARIKTLLNDPNNALHRKALEVTKAYLETFSRVTTAPDKRRSRSLQ
jgi:hypothetical protein